MHSEKQRMENEWIMEERSSVHAHWNTMKMKHCFCLTSAIALINIYLNFKDDEVNIFAVLLSSLVSWFIIPYLSHTHDTQ